jgi:8-oxo-dGTP pyrophosphatase MutT (NUDIX family)
MTKPWTVLRSHYLVKDKWMTLRVDTCKTASGVIVDPYYVQEVVDWVNIAAFDEDQRLLVVEQYRHAFRGVTIELPAGCVEIGEAPIESIKRELLEETGCEVRSIFELPTQVPNPARNQNKLYQFVALGTEITSPQNLEPSEGITFSFKPIHQVLALIDSGAFHSPMQTTNLFMGIRHLNALSRVDEIDWKIVDL